MLPFNLVYTPQELRAMSRLTPAGPHSPLAAPRTTDRSAERATSVTIVALVRRLLGRPGVRRSAPGTI
jgi:hypothetical protein